MSTSVKPIPEGMRTLTPHLICAGAADAIEFYKRAFNAVELFRLQVPNGMLAHACLTIGDSALMLVDEMPEHGALGPQALKGTPVVLHLFVPDVDAAIAQAVSAGATLKMPATDMFWGDRYGQVEDPFGHRWSLATHQRDLTPEQIAAAMASAPGCGG
ncbi:VOC family protein [Burkholderia sp. Ac-20353]|uniref:VOC family protein n=1 Tax=Burkholderia sp. Ac-20353 TaxID=2703894 RepID=UPI00197B6970|nr:VOC family protein [Burkholderia sp. Ac-20353]MBN3788284.1 VOC family protein [Burkholderia sp. Ac-20353]